MKTIHQPARDLPVIDETEVLVVGAGPAGIGAALAAGRSGGKTLLVEQFNCVGGMATSGLMSHFSGSPTSSFYREVIEAMEAHAAGQAPGARTGHSHAIRHESLKTILLRKLDEAKVGLRLHNRSRHGRSGWRASTGCGCDPSAGPAGGSRSQPEVIPHAPPA